MRIQEELGRGARAVVYRGQRGGRQYAVKVLAGLGDGGDAAEFRREAALLARVDHPGLVRVHEAGEVDGRPYLVMDLVEGKSLREPLRQGPLPPAQAARVGLDIADALGAAHRAGLTHRDIKPENVMLGTDGHARLIDFGLAGPAGDRVEDSAVGTFAYCAPEQTGGLHRPVDGRADLYALGVVLFECVAGTLPFTAEDAGEMIRLHITAPAPDLRVLAPQAPSALAAVVARLLAKDPDDRYQSAEGLGGDLARIAAGEYDEFPLDRSAPPPVDLAGPLVGRAKEYDRLRSYARSALSGTGAAAVLLGPGGIGKSRLAAELVAELSTGSIVGSIARSVVGAVAGPSAGGYLILRGTAGQESPVPLAPIRTAIERYLDTIDRLPDPERDREIGRLRAAAGGFAAAIAPLSPALARLLDTPDGAAPGDGQQFAEAIAALLANLAAAAGGAVLYLDDMQRCDGATRRVLRHLAPLLPETPLLVLVCEREDGGVLEDLGDAVRLRLDLAPLPDAAVTELVAGLLGAARVPGALVARLAARSGANPLVIREYLRAVLDAGLLRPTWDGWRLDESGLDVLALPVDVLDLFVRRVDGLSAQARQLLVIAAAAGDRFPYQMLLDLGGMDAPVIQAVIATAIGHRLVESGGEGAYAFVHRGVREALLDRLDEAERHRLHRRIATWLSAQPATDDRHVYELARHALLGDPETDPDPALRAATAAGARALAGNAPAEAFAFLDQAARLAEATGRSMDAAFHTDLGRAAVGVNAYDEALEHLGRALELESDPVRRARVYALLAQAYQLHWVGTAGYEMARLGLAELGHRVPRRTALVLLSTLWIVLAGTIVGRTPRRLRLVTGARRERYELICALLSIGAKSAAMTTRMWLTAVMDMRGTLVVARLGSGPERAWKLSGSATTASAIGRIRRRDRLIREATAIADRLPDPGVRASVQWLCAVAVDAMQPPGTSAGGYLRHVLETHGRWLDLGEYLTAVNTVATSAIVRGYVEEAAEWHRRGVSRARTEGEALGGIYSAIPAHVAAMGGRATQATGHLNAVREQLRVTPDNLAQRLLLAITATHVAVELGDLGEAFESAIREFDGFEVKPSRTWPHLNLYCASVASGRLAQAYAAFDSAAPAESRATRLAAARQAVARLGRAARGPLLRAHYDVARAALAVLGGEHASARHLLTAAADRICGRDIPIVEYDIARWRARSLMATGNAADARRQAGYALQLAGTHGWVNRAAWVRAEFGVGTPTGSHHLRRTGHAVPGTPLQQRRLQALHDVSRAAATVLEPRQLSRVALDEIVRIFGAERAFVFLTETEAEIGARTGAGAEVEVGLGAGAGAEGSPLVPYLGRDLSGGDLQELTGYGSTLVDRAYQTGEALVVTGGDEGRALGSRSMLLHGLRSIMVAPLTVNGRVHGVVYLDSRAAKGIFTPDDVDLLVAIANHVALALETARAAQLEVAVGAARRERDTAQMLHRTMAQIAGSLDPEEVIHRLLSSVARTLPVAMTALLRTEPDGTLRVALGLRGGVPDPALTGLTVDPKEDPGLATMLANLPAGRGDLAAARRRWEAVFGPDDRYYLAIPLIMRKELRGLLAVTGVRPFTDAETEIATALAGQGLIAFDNAELFGRVRELATHDGLTGLFNRRHFFDLATDRLDEDHPDRADGDQPDPGVAAIMVDIDHFKSINDTYGHAIGDEVIRTIGDRLARILREGDLLCRYGGEEFAALLPGASPDQARGVAERLHQAIREVPVPTAAGPVRVTVSVGLADRAERSDDLAALLGTADAALYQAKRQGRDRVAGGTARG